MGTDNSDPEMPREADLRKLLPPAAHRESRVLSSESVQLVFRDRMPQTLGQNGK